MNSFRAILTKEKQLIRRTKKKNIIGLCIFSAVYPIILDYIFPYGALFELMFFIPSLLMVIDLTTNSMIKDNEDQMLQMLFCHDLNKMDINIGKSIMPMFYGCLSLAISLTINVLLISLSLDAILMAIIIGILIMGFAIFASIFLSLFRMRREHYFLLNGLVIYLTYNYLLLLFFSNHIILLIAFMALIIVFVLLCYFRLSALETKLHFREDS